MKFSWSKKCKDNFDNLKGMLTITPTLKVEDLDKDFIVCVDEIK
jgi:hypothetical protein